MFLRKPKVQPQTPRECVAALRASITASAERVAKPEHPLFWAIVRADAGVQKTVRRSHYGWVSEVNTRRFGSLETKNSLEHDFLVRADACREWEIIVRRPFAMEWRGVGRKPIPHIPSFGAVYGGRLIVVDVLSEAVANSRTVLLRTEIMRRTLARFGVEYRVETEVWIRQQPALADARLLQGGRPYWPSTAEVQAVLALLKPYPTGLTPHQILAALRLDLHEIYLLYAMVFNGHLQLVGDLPLQAGGRLVAIAQS